MKRMIRFFGILWALCLLLIAPALADGSASYRLWVGGVQVTDANRDNITQAINSQTPNAASGVAAFDPAANTLILNNFAYTGKGHAFEANTAALYSELDSLQIAVSGTCLLSNAASDAAHSHGIYTTGHLVVEGDAATLTAIGGSQSARSHGVYLYDGNLTVNAGALFARGCDSTDVSTGIWCFNGDVIVNENSSLTASGGDSNISRGLTIFDELLVDGGVVEATAGKATSSLGISTNLVVSRSSKSRVTGLANSSLSESLGILLWGSADFSQGTLCGFGGESQSDKSYGIFIDEAEQDRLTLSGGTTVAQGHTASFNQPPVIDSAFAAAHAWYGQTEASANAAGKQPISRLAQNHTHKYVRIAPAAFDIPATGDEAPLSLWAALLLAGVGGLWLCEQRNRQKA